jgi:myo-inositol-1-phosphate synthase
LPNAQPVDVAPATGKLGVLLPGMGAVGTTFIAGCLAIRKGLAKPIGSLTQMGTSASANRSPTHNVPLINDYVPLAGLDDLVFGGWDVFEDDAYVAASRAGVLDGSPPRAARRGAPGHQADDGRVRAGVRQEPPRRLVMVWCGSTEIYQEPSGRARDHRGLRGRASTPTTQHLPSQIYAYARSVEGVPYANGAPNLTSTLPR